MFARVVASMGSWYVLQTEEGELPARLKGRLKLQGDKFTNPIAVGDYVHYEQNKDEDITITEVAHRDNYIIRRATHNRNKYHIVASNMHKCMILYTLRNPVTSLFFLDKAIIACEAYHITPIVLINKIDLLRTEEEQKKITSLQQMYHEIGYEVKTCSLMNNMQEILTWISSYKGETILLFGHSGVGKTTLMNKVDKNYGLKTQMLSTHSDQGKHTTSFARLYTPSSLEHISIMDTPGIKELELVEISKSELAYFFKEFRTYASQCQFINCIHTNEPNCAVKKAVATNQIKTSRYDHYLKISAQL